MWLLTYRLFNMCSYKDLDFYNHFVFLTFQLPDEEGIKKQSYSEKGVFIS